MTKKKIVAIDLSSTGHGGGPYVSNMRLMNSGLKRKYDFKPFIYRTELGRYISFKRILDIKKQLLEIKPDIVHFSGLQLMGIHIAIACRLAGIKNTVVTVHGFTNDALNASWIIRAIMNYILEPLTILLTKKNYGVSHFVSKRIMLNILKSRNCGYVYNIPTSDKVITKSFSIREELKIEASKTIIVTVGRVIKDKGFHILEDSIKQMESFKDIVFIIVGNGTYLTEMRNQLKDFKDQERVFFLGYRDDVSNILQNCDIFVLPTLHETLSIALLEASSASLPLIASNTGGVPEIVENGVNGILVTPGDSAALKDAIIQLYLNKTLREKYGANAFKKIAQKFSQNEIEVKIDTIYQSILR